MGADIGIHPFTPFPTWHAYSKEGKCAECFHTLDFALHIRPVRVARLAHTPLAGETVYLRWVDAAGAHVAVEADGHRMTVLPVDWLVMSEPTTNPGS
jgi:hypothetical protein